MARILAYHVSLVADLDVVERNVCNDPNRDGFLIGANVVCFTTTLYNGQLPTQSPYPRGAKPGGPVYRYVVQFNPRDFIKFKMAESSGQVHYLLLQESLPAELDVAQRLRERIPNNEDADWDTYFPNGRANEYTKGRTFVNVMFWHDVQVENTQCVAIVKQRINAFSYSSVRAMELDVWLSRIPDETISGSSSEVAQEEVPDETTSGSSSEDEEEEGKKTESSSASSSDSDGDEQSPSDPDDSSDGRDSDSDDSNSVSASASDSSSENSVAGDPGRDVDALASALSNTKLK